ncbi:marvel domain-containing protein [Dichotomopilus funicola]|uniref:Marvel domain-containing protein n=1 Tax=Dichotomopilus funicola TaxID=1934379 RepID=A0AAN6ZK56_9PEZI|nr:marvel domain-containing protein [Dichotomopilus funicola]
MYRPAAFVLRGLLFLTSLTILALAVTLIKGQVLDTSPVTTRYTTFTGGFGMITSGLGLLLLSLPSLETSLPQLVPIALDTLTSLFFAAGGIAWAVGLRGVDGCSNYPNMLFNPLLNQGSVDLGNGKTAYGVIGDGDDDGAIMGKLKGNCQRAQADEVLQFICFGFALSLVIDAVLVMRRGGRGGVAGAYVA